MRPWLRTFSKWYATVLRLVVLSLATVSGAGILLMMGVTVCDILLRRLTHHPVPGAMDIIQITGAITISCALPYTTAVKGHVAVEFFFQRLGRKGRIVVDTLARLCAIGLFTILAAACFWRGRQLYAVGEVTLTLEVPIFWVLYIIAFSCAVVALVILHNLLHPGREMIKP